MSLRREFHADGIVDEEAFDAQKRRILFVALEPNAKGGRYDRYLGWDLRALWRDRPLKKPFDLNVARWTRALLDGERRFRAAEDMSPEQTSTQLRRIAIINLKKLAGGGKQDSAAICVHAWQDRALIRKEIEIIRPTLIIACGDLANRLFAWIVNDDPHRQAPHDAPWRAGRVWVLPANHPSVRPKDARRAFRRLLRGIRKMEVGARYRREAGRVGRLVGPK